MGEILRLVQLPRDLRKASDSAVPDASESLFLNGDHRLRTSAAPVPFGCHSPSFASSPVSALGSVLKPGNYPATVERLIRPQMVFIEENVISMGIISRAKSIELLDKYEYVKHIPQI